MGLDHPSRARFWSFSPRAALRHRYRPPSAGNAPCCRGQLPDALNAEGTGAKSHPDRRGRPPDASSPRSALAAHRGARQAGRSLLWPGRTPLLDGLIGLIRWSGRFDVALARLIARRARPRSFCSHRRVVARSRRSPLPTIRSSKPRARKTKKLRGFDRVTPGCQHLSGD